MHTLNTESAKRHQGSLIITLSRNSQMVSSTLYSFKIYSPNTNVTFAVKSIMEDKKKCYICGF
jgi:hypothetical protein